MQEKILICVILLLLGLVSGFLNSYENRQVLHNGDYIMGWRISGDEILLSFEVKATGWIGFGLGEQTSGSMPGADVVVVEFLEHSARISDRHTLGFFEPIEDNCQDWILLEAQQANGISYVEIARKLTTNDPQDRPFVMQDQSIIYAWGNSGLDYHSANRGIFIMDWIAHDGRGLNPGEAESLHSFEVRMGNAQLPAQETWYACQSFEIPLDIEEDAHLIGLEVLTDPVGEKYLHHAVMSGCGAWDLYGPRDCFIKEEEDPMENASCATLWAWAPGRNSMWLPSPTGFRIGPGENSIRYIHLQMHYNNPLNVANLIDTSGFRLTYTTQLRQHDAGTLTLGDLSANALAIPPRTKAQHYEFDCPEECTQDWPHEITVFFDFLHAHQVGSELYSTHWRNNEFLGVINHIEFYQFELQQETPVKRVIKPGDRINTHCIYDTTDRADPVTFGISSQNEMCLEFITYYPVLPARNKYCGSLRHRNEDGQYFNFTTCPNLLKNNKDEYISNPVHPDPPALVPRLFGASLEGQECDLDLSANPQIIVANGSGASGLGFLMLLFLLSLNM